LALALPARSTIAQKSFRYCVRKLIKRLLPLACSKSNPLEDCDGINQQTRRGFIRSGFFVGAGFACDRRRSGRTIFFRQPHDLEPAEEIRAEHFAAAFWWYLGANACIGASLADFALIGFHLQKTAAVAKDLIPNFI
jgi:hypothetical protein